MKVKVITRTAESCTRERKGDIFIMKRNPDPALHPFDRAREYVRAVNAAKLDRLFAKPFIASLGGHVDGIYCMAKHPTELKLLASGSADGEIRLWNVGTRKCLWNRREAHTAFIRGLAFLPQSSLLLSCGDDKVVRMWETESSSLSLSTPSPSTPKMADQKFQPASIFYGNGTFTSIDGHRNGQLFATSGSQEISIWDCERAEPTKVFSWGADTINCVRFNQAEPWLLASCASDRSLMLHDMRISTSLAKIILKMRSNSLCWNPQEAISLTVANEDHNCYTFDIRYLDKAVNVLQGHTSAVIDLDYASTGQEIVTGGYDRSLRIFNVREGRSRDIYHTKRMQRLFCIKYSMDSNYIFSGSDDGNVRIWKAHSSEKLGVKNHRQNESLNYSAALLDRYKALPTVRRIATHRSIPKEIKIRAHDEHEHRMALKRRQENVIKHSKPGTVVKKSIREEVIVDVKK